MTQYMLTIYQPDGGPPPPEFMEPVARALHAMNQDLKAAGAWVFSRGLCAPSTATVVRVRDQEILTTDGPYVEGKEHIGGFWIIDAPISMPPSALRARRPGRPPCPSRSARSRTSPSTKRRLDPSRASDIERVFRAEHGRAVAVLVRVFGDIDVAEEAVADAFTAAVQRWPTDGLPPSPAGWIITTARNRAIDRLRREASRAQSRRSKSSHQHATKSCSILSRQ